MAAVDPARPITSADDLAVSIAAQLCWHAFRICQAMAASLDGLQDDLAEISRHCDALIEMALDLDRQAEDDAHPAGVCDDRPA
ncbi:MAG: hypothetical protein KY462_16305 [Actinobacteria bacterium]|nr:hypothetical protein [Actinomycetota bacterium]